MQMTVISSKKKTYGGSNQQAFFLNAGTPAYQFKLEFIEHTYCSSFFIARSGALTSYYSMTGMQRKHQTEHRLVRLSMTTTLVHKVCLNFSTISINEAWPALLQTV